MLDHATLSWANQLLSYKEEIIIRDYAAHIQDLLTAASQAPALASTVKTQNAEIARLRQAVDVAYPQLSTDTQQKMREMLA